MDTVADGMSRSMALLKLTQIAWSFARLLSSSGVVRRQSFKQVSRKSLWIANTLSIVLTVWQEECVSLWAHNSRVHVAKYFVCEDQRSLAVVAYKNPNVYSSTPTCISCVKICHCLSITSNMA